MSEDKDAPAANRTIFRPSPLQGLKTPTTAPTATPIPSAAPVAAPAPAAPAAIVQDDVPAPFTPQVLRNWLMGEAAPLLALIASVRTGRARVALPDLNRRAAAAIERFDASIADYYDAPQRAVARYALCATVDDVVTNLPGIGADAEQWQKRSMVSTFVKDDVEEDRFWKACENLLGRPEQNRDMIELYHACIAAGYKGRFHSEEGGRDTIRDYMTSLNDVLDKPRSVQLVRQWKGQNAPMKKVGFGLYVALAAAAALLLLVALYFVVNRATILAAVDAPAGLSGRT